MKSVLMSIQPYWMFLIIAHKMGWQIGLAKTVEVRKNYPKAEDWDKTGKLYCSKDKKSFARIPKEYQPLMEQFLGKVVGEFVCDAIISHCEMANADIAEQQGCIKREKLFEYANGKELYGWRISNLVIYDKPKELYNFQRPCNNDCEDCEYLDVAEVGAWEHTAIAKTCLNFITRPPQSWMYCESEVSNNDNT